jgi:N-acetylmuramoyl-L-alanine amidase
MKRLSSIKILALAASIICLAAFDAQAQKIKVLRGDRDTVFTQKHTILCQTEPGNVAAIGDKQVTVYKTGAFGAEVNLKEGHNKIEITVFKGKSRALKEIDVFYTKQIPAAPERKFTMAEAEREILQNVYSPRSFKGVTKDNAYMQFGDGSDRLGGSKMGFLDDGVELNVVGKIGDLYKVQLSQNRFAYVPVENVQVSASGKDESDRIVNTSTWNVRNEGKMDRIVISLPKKLPYASWIQLDPTTLCVDIYGATNNSNWIIQRQNLQMIDYVDWLQVDSDVFRVIVKLKNKYSWGYSVHYDDTNLTINVKHAPELTLKGMTIGIDAGHGGSAPGAISPTGIEEKNVNLSIVKELKKQLEAKGAKVVLSRPRDMDITMAERKKVFNDANIDLMVSIHNNAGGSAITPMGTSTYYKNIANRDLANCLLVRMLELGVPNYGLVGNFNFSLCQPTEYPSALVECLFMSSLPDEEKLADSAYHKTIAAKVVLGLEDYLAKVNYAEYGIDTTSKKKK